MSPALLIGLIVLAVVFLFAAGAPVAFSLGGTAMLFGAFTWGPQSFKLIPTTALNSISSFILLAIPLFLFMGQILMRSGLGEQMFRSANAFLGRLPGGLAVAVILVCSLVGAMVGIIGAGILLAGSVAIPPMLKRGYDRFLTLGTVMAGGGLGILIPPSIPMILFSATTKASLGKMFAGALMPAAIMVGLFILYIGIRCWLRPEMGPPLPKAERHDRKEWLLAFRNGVLALALVFAVLGTILLGIATPTEAGAIGVIGAVLLAILFRKFGWQVLKEGSINTMRVTGMVVWMLVGASIFSNFNMLMGAGKLLNFLTLDLGLGPMGVIAMMQLSMLILGCFIDEYIIVLICAPIYTPIAVQLGFDPVWFGILMILNLEIAIQTPPYGFALFYLKSVAPPDVTMLDIYRSIAPFVTIKLVVLVICMLVPEIVTWLPNLLFE